MNEPAPSATGTAAAADDATAAASPALDLALIIGLAGALVYAAGWAYAYRWYARFDLGINGLDLPVETLLMYGFWTLTEHVYLVMLAALGAMVWAALLPPARRWAVRLAPVLLLLAVALVYFAGGYSADERFEAHSAAGFRCLPLARVGLIPEAGRAPAIAELAHELAERGPDPDARYRLLLQTKSLLVLIKPKPQGPPVPVLVPLGRVDAVRLSAVIAGCD